MIHLCNRRKPERKLSSLVMKGSFGWEQFYVSVPLSETAFADHLVTVKYEMIEITLGICTSIQTAF